MLYRKDKAGLFVPVGEEGSFDANNLFHIGGVFKHAYRAAGDDRPDHELDWQEDHNLIHTAGLTYFLDASLHAGSQFSTLYVALYTANYTPVLADVMANFQTNYVELTDISQATRPTWSGVRTGTTSSNTASKATFTASGGAYPITVYGASIVSNNTKGGTTGTQLASTAFSSSRVLAADSDEILVTYEFTAANA